MFTSHRALPAITLLIAPGLFAQSLGPVRNAASHDERFSPGTLVEINGPFTPTSGPVTAEVGGRAAAVIAHANSQLVIQLPVELTPGAASLMVTSGGVRLSPISLTIEVYAPGLYTASPYSSVGMFYRTQSSVGWPFGVDCGHPVWPRDANEVVRVYATGLGATNPAVATGEAAPANPAASTVSKPSISVSGRAAEVLSAVLSPGLAGVYQVDFRLPAGLGDSFHPMTLSIGGASSNVVMLPMGNTFYNLSAAKLGGWPQNEEWVAAPDSIVSARPCGGAVALAISAAVSDPRNPPETLNGTTVRVRDSLGVERAARLIHVSPFQIDYIIPEGTALGRATVAIMSATYSGSITATATLEIQPVVPALFTRDGFNVALQLLRTRNGVQTIERPDQAIAWVDDSDEWFLVLFGTGFRFRTSEANVRVNLGGVDLAVEYAGRQDEFAGLDQLNVRLPRSLRDRAPGYWLGLTVDGKILLQDLGHDLTFK